MKRLDTTAQPVGGAMVVGTVVGSEVISWGRVVVAGGSSGVQPDSMIQSVSDSIHTECFIGDFLSA